MSSRSDNTSKWKQLSEIDYFGLFIKNWLAFNSWYRGHHPNLKSDRDCIDAIKNIADSRNSAYLLFKKIFEGNARESISFRDNLDGLVISLNRVTLSSDNYEGALSFSNVLIDKKTDDYQNLLKSQSQKNKVQLGTSYVTDDVAVLYKGTIELIYQVRCLLFHGELEPTDENHQVVKYCYLVVNSMMKNL